MTLDNGWTPEKCPHDEKCSTYEFCDWYEDMYDRDFEPSESWDDDE